MRTIVPILLLLSWLLPPASAPAATIQHFSTGRPQPEVRASFSRNKGAAWQHAVVKPGQAFSVPNDATHLTINDVPRDPRKNWRAKDGSVF